ncbi:MAG: DUF3226 domain-containing protein [Methylosarcina sp.]
MSNNLLVVESENDKFFIERLKQEITSTDFDVDEPVCMISEYECLGGLSQSALENKLHGIKRDIAKKGLDKIGILVDADQEGIDAKVRLVNAAIKSIDPALSISTTNSWYRSATLDVQISCHVLNVNGSGELETLLKTIKSKDSSHADCLAAWKNCLTASNKTINDKDFDKFWLNVYLRYDGCSHVERRQAGKKCNLESSLKKDLWDFSHPCLNDLIRYLQTFNSQH